MIIEFEDDLDVARIADSGQCFRWEKTDRGYRIPFGRLRLYIDSLSDTTFELDCSRNEYDEIWALYFDAELSYRDIRALADDGNDPFMKAACDDQRGIRILRQDPWETAVSFIISQNRNIPAIKKSIELLCEACGDKEEDRRGEAFFVFPSPDAVAALSQEKLDQCKLGYRAGYIRRFAEDVAAGRIDLEKLSALDEEKAFRELTSIYGIGPKVANCINLFGLHHLNAFPIDTWIKKILENEYENGYPFERYSPYNGIFQQYMFAYYRKIKS